MIKGLEFDDIILGLDVATVTGWAVLHGDAYYSGVMPFKPERRLVDFERFIVDMVEQWKPAMILAEDVYLDPKRADTTKKLVYMHGVLLKQMSVCTSIFRYIGNKRAKSVIGDNGNMTTKQKEGGAMVRALAYKGFEAPGTNEADALAIALAGRLDMFGRLT